MSKSTILPTALLLSLAAFPGSGHGRGDDPAPQTHSLKATPKTVAWGYYDASARPVLRIKSGDTVEVQTLLTNSPAGLEGRSCPPPTGGAGAARRLQGGDGQGARRAHPHRAHLTSRGPSRAMRSRCASRRSSWRIPYALQRLRPAERASCPEDFPHSRMKIIPLDEKRMVAHFAEGIEIPLRPFFGSMGVAPPPSAGRISSGPPGVHAGNLDNKELVAGTTLFIPVHVAGALFAVGDGHAGQGNGEVDITALETSLHGTLAVRRPQGPEAALAPGRDADALHRHGPRQGPDAGHEDRRARGDRLPRPRRSSSARDDAYMLASVAVDFRVTQVVDGTKGVHGMIPKAIFKAK